MSLRTRVRYSLIAVCAAAVAGAACSRQAQEAEVVEILEAHDVSALNQPLHPDTPTVDVVVFHSDNTEVTWPELREEFATADSIFRSYGVQLNLKEARKVAFPASWAGMASGQTTNVPTDDMDLDFYDLMDYEQVVVSERLEFILNAFLAEEEDAERTIYIIPLSGLTVSWHEKNENNEWVEVTSPTSAISFPPYSYADRIPKHLRGVISFQRSHANRRVLAHELGHKLINVSHEGLDVCPQGDGTEVPGLLGYGESTEIFGGEEGRWHQERLMLSPFLYRTVNGEKVWNDEYETGGNYADPIYEGLIMEPACPSN